MDEITLGQRIRAVRETAGLSREQFAEKLAVTPATVGRYEKNERIPDANFLHQLVMEFECDPRWLLVGKGSMKYRSIDDELLEAMIELADELIASESNGEKATPKQKTRLALALYDLANEREDHVIDRLTAVRYFKLMAA